MLSFFMISKPVKPRPVLASLCVCLAGLLLAQVVHAQTPAFPGALGFGAYATGGRNGTVYHVTNLNDSGPGSFRDAVSHSGRTIVFDVGGEIKLSSAVSCAGDLTIAGQTAPGGIVFDGGEISFANRNNIICRYIRIRPGSDTASSSDDALSFYRASNLIVDHCSIAFAPWNNIDGVGDSTHLVTAITVQNSINANPTGQQFGCHSESVGGQWSWQYNIFANSHNRNPLSKVNDTFINNLEYNNSAGYTAHTSTPFEHDIVNNYFIAGPASGSNFPWYQIANSQSIYYSGNMYDSDKNGVLGGSITTPYWYQGVGTVLSSPWSSWTTLIPTMTSQLAYRYDVSASGAFPRDQVDSLILSQIQTLGSGTTGTGSGTTGPDGGLYTSQSQTGLSNNGYGTLTGLTAPTDTDGDGMPDYWEEAIGSAVNSPNALTNTIDGYTPLEHYLNFLAAPHAVTPENTAVKINLRQFTSGFSPSATFALSDATNGTVSLVNSTNANFVPQTGFTGLGEFKFTVNDGGSALSAMVTICVTPATSLPDGVTQFHGSIIGVNFVAQAPPANLVWRGDGTANNWDTTTTNWLDGNSPASFNNRDVVTFDDTGSSTPAINLIGTLAPGAIYVNADQDYTFGGSGALTGSGTLTKTGSGTLTIANVNSGFSGSVNVSDSTLALNNGASIGSGSMTLNNATVSLAGGHTATYISGTLTIPGGQTGTISSGYIANGCSGNIVGGNTSSVLNIDGGLSLASTSSSQLDGFPGTINLLSGGRVRFSANSSGHTYGSSNPAFVIDGTLQPRNAGNTIALGDLSGTGTLSGPQSNAGSGDTLYEIGAKNLDNTFSGVISSDSAVSGSLVNVTKVGTGALTLSGANTFTGTCDVSAGTLLINGSSEASQTTVSANATLGGTGAINGTVTVNSSGQLAPGADGVGTLTINGNLNNNNPTLYFDLSSSPSGANDRINMTGTLAMSGVQNFVFNLVDNTLGAGTYDLIEGATSSTAWSGTTMNLPGTTRQTFSLVSPAAGSNPSYVRLVVTGSAASLVWRGTNGVNWDTSTVNWANGSTADHYYNLDQVTFDDTGANASSVTLVSTITPASITVNASQDYDFAGSGALAGSGPLTKSGSGTLTVSTANNSYTGDITINGGTLSATSGSDLGTGTLTLDNGATFNLDYISSSLVFASRDIMVPANQTGTLSSDALGNGFSGNLSSGNSASVLDLSGGISFSGTSTAEFDNFAGTINIQSGATLRFSSNSSGNTYGSTSPTFVIDGTMQPRNAGNTILLGAFSGSGTLAGPQSNGGSGDTLYDIGGNNADSTFSGVISSDSAVAGSAVAVTKDGSGTLTLSGNSTYTGGTTVNSGTLRALNTSGSATGSGDLEISANATLTGDGIIASSTTVDDGATLAPGNPDGALTFTGNLTLNDNSILQFALGSSSDSIVVNGNLILTGQLEITNATGFGPGTYPIFTCSGSLDLGALTLASAPSGYNYSFDTNTTGVVKLVVAPTTPPAISSPGINAGGNFVFSGSGGTPGGTYYTVTSTNIAAPLANWTPISTNQFDGNGNFSVTNPPPTNAQSFYRLEVP